MLHVRTSACAHTAVFGNYKDAYPRWITRFTTTKKLQCTRGVVFWSGAFKIRKRDNDAAERARLLLAAGPMLCVMFEVRALRITPDLAFEAIVGTRLQAIEMDDAAHPLALCRPHRQPLPG